MKSFRPVRMSFLLLAGVLLAAGACNPPGAKKAGGAAAHDHGEDGPHGGAIAEGPDEKYHAEFLPDHGKKQVTVWILDSKAKNPVAIKPEGVSVVISNFTPPVKIDLKPEPQQGDAPGMSSRFVGNNDKLAEEKDYEGEIVGTVDGKPYTWKFKEKPEHDEKAKK